MEHQNWCWLCHENNGTSQLVLPVLSSAWSGASKRSVRLRSNYVRYMIRNNLQILIYLSSEDGIMVSEADRRGQGQAAHYRRSQYQVEQCE